MQKHFPRASRYAVVLAHASRWADTGKVFLMRLVMCSECCLCSAPGGEWESGRKFAQTVSKFWRVCMLMVFPADYTKVSDRVDPLKEYQNKNIYIYVSPVSHHHICNSKRAKQERCIKKNKNKNSRKTSDARQLD